MCLKCDSCGGDYDAILANEQSTYCDFCFEMLFPVEYAELMEVFNSENWKE